MKLEVDDTLNYSNMNLTYGVITLWVRHSWKYAALIQPRDMMHVKCEAEELRVNYIYIYSFGRRICPKRRTNELQSNPQ